MKNLILFVLFGLLTYQLQAQDLLATVYFYRECRLFGYDLKHNDAVIGHIKSNSVITYRCQPGLQTFKASTESESSMKLDVKAGQTYFVECGLAVGVTVARPSFRQDLSQEARKKIERIETIATNTTPGSEEPVFSADTARALQNLYKRKRKGGTTRAIVFGVLGFSSLVGTVAYKPHTVTINQGSAGSQTFDTSSGPSAVNYIFIGFSAIMSITGITQTTKYSVKNLDALLNDYKQGKPLTALVKGNLKKKDFK